MHFVNAPNYLYNIFLIVVKVKNIGFSKENIDLHNIIM